MGMTRWQQTTQDVVFARGLGWPDAAEAAKAIAELTRPIVLVPEFIQDKESLSNH